MKANLLIIIFIILNAYYNKIKKSSIRYSITNNFLYNNFRKLKPTSLKYLMKDDIIKNKTSKLFNGKVDQIKISVFKGASIILYNNSVIKFLKIPSLEIIKKQIFFTKDCNSIEWVDSLNINPSRDIEILSSSQNKKIIFWNSKGDILGTFKFKNDKLLKFGLGINNNFLYCLGLNTNLTIWDIEYSRLVAKIAYQGLKPIDYNINHYGSKILLSFASGTYSVWSLESLEKLGSISNNNIKNTRGYFINDKDEVLLLKKNEMILINYQTCKKRHKYFENFDNYFPPKIIYTNNIFMTFEKKGNIKYWNNYNLSKYFNLVLNKFPILKMDYKILGNSHYFIYFNGNEIIFTSS